jgi:hypothetical protein
LRATYARNRRQRGTPGEEAQNSAAGKRHDDP